MVADHNESDDGDDSAPQVAPSMVRAAQRSKVREKSKQTSLLSFEDDVRRSRNAHGKIRPSSFLKEESLRETTAMPAYTQVSGAGEYTMERLKELQESTRRLPSDAARPRPDGDVPFVLSGGFVQEAPKDDRFDHNLERVPEKKDEGGPLSIRGFERVSSSFAEAAHTAPDRSVRPAVANDAEVEEMEISGRRLPEFPDAETIKEAKMKRERMRAGLAAAPDYISIYESDGLDSEVFKDALERRQWGTDRGEPTVSGQRMGHEGQGSDGEDEDFEELTRVRFGVSQLSTRGGAEDRPRGRPKDHGRAIALPTTEQTHMQDDGQEDEEVDAWMESQLRKGIASGTAKPPRPSSFSSGRAGAALDGLRRREPMLDMPVLRTQTAEIHAAADMALDKLRTALHRARLSHRQTETNLQQTLKSLRENATDADEISTDLARAGDRYVFLQSIRVYMAALCAMLAEKSPIVEELQEELQRAREERALAAFIRQRDTRREEEEPARAAAEASMAVLMTSSGRLSSGGDETLSTMAAAAEEAAKDAEERLARGGHIPPELDEFGRDINAIQRAKVVQRMKHAASRRANEEESFRRAASDNGDGIDREEPSLGDATSEEDEEAVVGYRSRVEEIYETAESVFKDASDDFNSIERVKDVLESWKFKFPAQYRDAYVGLSAPALFAPFVRLELLHWDPLGLDGSSAVSATQNVGDDGSNPSCDTLEDRQGRNRLGFRQGTLSHPSSYSPLSGEGLDHKDGNDHSGDVRRSSVAQFDQQDWYRHLFHYGIPEEHGGGTMANEQTAGGLGEADAAADVDNDLVPRIVRSLIAPLSESLLEHVWNPWSHRQSLAASELLSDVMIYVPDPAADEVQTLIAIVIRRFEEALKRSNVPTWTPAALKASPRAEVYVARCFGRALRLLRAISAFVDVLPTALIKRWAVEELLSKQLVPHVRAGLAISSRTVADRAQRVLDSLPERLWTADASGRGMLLNELVAIREVSVAAARALQELPKDEADKKGLRLLRDVLACLGDAKAPQRPRGAFT